MVKNCIKIYAAGITTSDNVATIVVPVPSTLVEVRWNATGTNAGAVGTAVILQLSTMGTSSFSSNDVRGIIDEVALGSDKAINMAYNFSNVTQIPGLRFAAGDVIRLHRSIVIAPTGLFVYLNLYFA